MIQKIELRKKMTPSYFIGQQQEGPEILLT